MSFSHGPPGCDFRSDGLGEAQPPRLRTGLLRAGALPSGAVAARRGGGVWQRLSTLGPSDPERLSAVSGILAPKITSSWAPFGIRSESVRGPFGICSGSIRDPFGSISDENFWSHRSFNSKIFNLCGGRRCGGGPLAAVPSPAARRVPTAAATAAQIEIFCENSF